ncbi:serine/threonine protein kinase [Amorphoplanes auranticolor]|uniref:histidine kinase n=2 Tax=Actinoplanes auranticolor TaxID=47988 RepID=A0A919SY62_9ACTN|nr:serine/threonine protein kinase [Actinoplanes auranticolor]
MTDAEGAERDAGAVRPGGTVLYESERARVIRSPAAGGEPGGVIWKEPLGPGAAERLRREVAILSRLAGVPGVAQLAKAAPGATGFALIDVGGVSLADLRGLSRAGHGVRTRTEVLDLVSFALSLVQVLAGVHRAGVLHLDVNPANILVAGPGQQPFLIDWDLASTAPEQVLGFVHETTLAGTPAYLAPEQTGRTGRGVDHRTDLYAVGATLYELAVGAPPFGEQSADMLALIHDHLARIPTAPSEANEAVPTILSDIILRLLEKEPDRRYQSASGLVHDLARLRAALLAADPIQDVRFVLGEHDFPMRICAPSRLVGREAELDALRRAFDLAMTGQERVLLITGGPGVGKTVLAGELRPIVAAADGWYVQGKFDQYRQDVSTDAVAQVMRALGRLLLAEPEAQVSAVRARIARTVGADAGLVAAVCPEYAILLDVVPAQLDVGDTRRLAVRLRQAALGVLRAVVSPERPIVMVIDNLQWAGAYPIEFLDAVLTAEDLPGLLLVGAYRDCEVDGSPFSAMQARWARLDVAPARLNLVNLPPAHLGTLLAGMLRMPDEGAADLADAINVHTAGNPYDTVELVNALRREGILRADDAGWRWDAGEVRTHIGIGDIAHLLAERIGHLPAGTAQLLEVLACLGGEVEVALFAVATGLDVADAVESLMPALEDGLLVMVHDAAQAVRFRHERVQQAAIARLGAQPRSLLHVELARRLAAHAHLQEAAAEQYLAGVADVTDAAEQYRVAQLFQAAAAQSRLINQPQAERFQAAALTLLRTGPTDPSGAANELVTRLLIDRHASLVNLVRLEEADQLYEEIKRRVPDPVDSAVTAALQMTSLTRRARPHEAVTLGIDLLTELDFPPPAPDSIAAELERGMDVLYRWVAEGPSPDELDRSESGDPRAVAAARLIARIVPAAFYFQHPLLPWLMFTAHRLWAEHGPSRELVPCLGAISVLGISIRQDYALGYRVCRRVLSVSEAHAYEPETAQLRDTLATFGTPWFEPLEEVARLSRTARECLLRYGELQFASFAYINTLWAMLDCAPTLDDCVVENRAAMALWARSGDESLTAGGRSYQQFLRCLRGETDAPGSFDDSEFDELAYLAETSENSAAVCKLHYLRALAAAVFGDVAGLTSYSASAIRLVHHRPGLYSSAMIYLLHGLAVAAAATAAPPSERPALLAEFDADRSWLAARAGTAPENFAHLVSWLDAERAWAQDDFRSAVRHFDAAMSRSGSRRPGHAAMITERAARFHLAHGLDQVGRILLAETRDRYDRWGADAKVVALHREFPSLRSSHGRAGNRLRGSAHSTMASSDTIDLLAVVRASQALSSETNLDTLRIRVVEVLTALTGATSVRLLLWNEDARDWFLPASDGQNGRDPEAALRAGEAGAAGMICLSAFRYAERTREPLVVPDATCDDRFSRDPHLKGMSSCSLLVMPIISRGTLRAMLLMENTLSPGVFSSYRLDAVVLIAGQLAVSLDNALAERFRSLVQRSSGLTLVCDREGILTYASSASADILGAQDVSLVGRPVVELVDPQDRDGFTAWIGDGGPDSQLLECRVTRTDSGPRWVEISRTDLTADPAVAGLVLHLRDVSERRHLESELRHAQKLESVGQLAAGVAHEINTPIQFISNNLLFIAESIDGITALLEEYRQAIADPIGPDRLEARRQAFAKREADLDLEFLREELPLAAGQALEGTERVSKIVRAMKAFAHPGGDQKSLADVNEAIRTTLTIANSEIKLVADVVLDLDDLPPVWCNVGDINQAVLNLVVNAAHAIGEAGATGRGRGTLTVRTRAEEGVIVIEVEDTGNGIPPEIADRVFEHFFTTKPVGVGTGQGLALAYTLIHDRHAGTITFTSEPGIGTTFTIRLPQPAGSNQPSSAQTSRPLLAGPHPSTRSG